VHCVRVKGSKVEKSSMAQSDTCKNDVRFNMTRHDNHIAKISRNFYPQKNGCP
jgi:hypothetical protein